METYDQIQGFPDGFQHPISSNAQGNENANQWQEYAMDWDDAMYPDVKRTPMKKPLSKPPQRAKEIGNLIKEKF